MRRANLFWWPATLLLLGYIVGAAHWTSLEGEAGRVVFRGAMVLSALTMTMGVLEIWGGARDH